MLVFRLRLAAGVEPDAVLWSDDADEAGLFAGGMIVPKRGEAPGVSAAFLDMARSAAAHLEHLRRLKHQEPAAGEEYG